MGQMILVSLDSPVPSTRKPPPSYWMGRLESYSSSQLRVAMRLGPAPDSFPSDQMMMHGWF